MVDQEEQQKKVTNAREWRKKKGKELDLPSGNVALVQRPDLRKFVSKGQIPDALTGIVKASIAGNEQAKAEMEEAVKNDPEMLGSFVDFLDYVVLSAVLQPKVAAIPMQENEDGSESNTPIPLDERNQSVLYVDEVDMDDKMFIFQYAIGGTTDLESFRHQQEELLGSLLSGEDVADKAE